MKKILLILFLIGTKTAFSQYSPQRTADIAAQRFQHKLDETKENWDNLFNLQLYNKVNSRKLDVYRSTLKAEWEEFTGKYYDRNNLSYFNTYNSRINQYLSDPNIKTEIGVLDKISTEIRQMKYNDPGKFTEYPRYKELMEVIIQIENCQPNEIRNIAMKHGLIY